MLRVKVNRKAFLNLQATLNDLKTVPSRAAAVGARLLDRELRRTWKASLDPYGVPWADLRPATYRKGRGRPFLIDTGNLTASFSFSPRQSAGIQLKVGLNRLAAFHQYGTVNMVARPVAPSRDRGGLPRAWRDALARAIRSAY